MNLFSQKEEFTLLDSDKKLSVFAPILIATLGTCAQIERENIKFRLNSGRKQYVENGGRLGRKVGRVKDNNQFLSENKDVIKLLNQGYSIRKIAKLVAKSPSTKQKGKKFIAVK